MYYRQCIVQYQMEHSSVNMTTWLPEKYAKRGKYLKLKGRDGWMVIEVGSHRYTEEEAVDRAQDHKRTRKASDI